MPHNFSKKILSWFKQHGRHTLPWQVDPTPYRVWISEVMLQQTQVTTVLAYFQRFTQQFPTIEDLAKAHQDEVLSLWSGLGYYSRARNLHRCAQIIVEQYQGHWPMEVALLEKLPGIGRSTAGAIISLSGNHFAPILDGNVKRVLARYFAIDCWPGESKIQQFLWEKAEQLTSKENPKNFNQAMMDLGSLICTRTKPRCSTCPLQEDCQAFYQEKTLGKPAHEYPRKKPKASIPSIHKQFLLISLHNQTSIWLYKRPPIGIWGGLWSLPELNMEEDAHQWVFKKGFHCLKTRSLPSFKHVFSHFILHLHPVQIIVETDTYYVMEEQECGFYSFESPWPGGLAAPISKLLQHLYCTRALND